MSIVKINNCGQGVNLDLSPEELPIGVWSDVSNIRFLNGYAQRFKGLAQVFDDPTITPHFIAPFQTPDKKYWVHAGTDAIFVDDGTTRTEIEPTNAGETISSITRSGSTATLTTAADHGLTTGMVVIITGATPANFNGTYTITVTGLTTFEYTVANSGATTASPVGSYTFVHELTGGIDDRWMAAAFSGFLVMNNGVDHPHYWDGDVANKMYALPGWTSTWVAQGIYSFKNFLVAINITKGSDVYPHMVKWSTSAVPGALPTSWDETDVTLDAGESDLSETPDLIVDALPLGDSLVIYKERSMYSMRFVGAPFIFQFQRLPGESGMLTRGCGAVTPVGNVVLSAGDVVLNTGQGVRSIADGKIRRYIFNNIDSTNFRRTFVTTNPQRNEVLICFPFNGSDYCDKAAVWNWETGEWGLRDLSNVTYGAPGLIDFEIATTWASDPEAWMDDSTTWNENEYSPNEARLLLTSTTKILAFDVGSTDDGEAFSGVLTRTGMHFDDPYSMKLVRAVYPRIDTADNVPVTVEIGAAYNADQEPTWSAATTFTSGQNIKVDSFATGRYLAIRITCEATFRVRSFDMDVVVTGVY